MSSLVAGLSVAALVAGEWPGPAELPNIGYLALGYNIYLGNPRATAVGADPGFQHYPVYQQSYPFWAHKTGDGRYTLPTGFTAVSDVGCALDFNSDSAYEVSSYINDLNKYTTSGFRIPLIARFSASADYNEFHMRTQSSNERLVSSAAECVVYDAAVDKYDKPPLTRDFILAVRQLPENYGNGEQFFDFLDNFGTHTLQAAKMGSRYGYNAYFNEMSWTNVERMGVSVTHAASLFGLYHATRQSNTSVEINVFKQNMDAFKEITLGAKPQANGDANAWAAQVIKEPMPISYSLVSLCDAISDDDKKTNCEKAQQASEYCSKRLQDKRRAIANCSSVPYYGCLWDGDCQKGVCVNNQCSETKHTMMWRPSNGTLCLALAGSRLSIETCNSKDSNQQWTFNSGEYQNYLQIQLAADTTKCVDANGLTNGQPLTINHCSGAPSQTWARDIKMGALYSPHGKDGGNICMDAGSGIKAGSPMLVWQCNVLPQQQFDLVPINGVSNDHVIVV